ncbi:MAG TPA: DNA polymerase III subunit beta, partial [Bacillota bacterium]|nr:DNA polymerase III subunit beta [Bacillota bacterium]
MKINCNQNNFLNSILTVQKASSANSTLPVLQGILIEARDDHLVLTGTNLELGIESHMNAEILKTGRVVVPTRLLSEIVRKLPNAEMEIEVLENYTVKITCLNSVVTIQGLDPEEFPALPIVDEGQTLQVNQKMLLEMIKQTVFAVAIDESRPILTGALLEVRDNTLNIICLDGYRLALRRGKIDIAQKEKSVVIPGKSLIEIAKIINDDNIDITIMVTDKHVLFDLGETIVISRVLEGEYINYQQIIPTDYKLRVKVDSDILLASIERASLIAREGKNNLLKLNIKDQKMVITSNSEAGQIYEEIPI